MSEPDSDLALSGDKIVHVWDYTDLLMCCVSPKAWQECDLLTPALFFIFNFFIKNELFIIYSTVAQKKLTTACLEYQLILLNEQYKERAKSWLMLFLVIYFHTSFFSLDVFVMWEAMDPVMTLQISPHPSACEATIV